MILPEVSHHSKRQKLSMLLSAWLSYFKTNPNRFEAFSDLGSWLMTTFLRRDLIGWKLPWITYPSIKWLRTRVQPGERVFEWGSGGSTLFFLDQGLEIISVEHDLNWHLKVKSVIEKNHAAKVNMVNLSHIAPQAAAQGSEGDGPAPDVDDPLTAAPQKGELFYEYTQSIQQYPDQSFDYILVDGRARVGCLKMCLKKIKVGGAVILDNSERAHYDQGVRLFEEPDWQVIQFPGPGPLSIWPVFWQTTVFIKR
jgi:hypothetical protein